MTHRWHAFLAGSFVLLCSSLLCTRARAEVTPCTLDPEASTWSEYQRAIALALREYRAQHFLEARASFEHAHALCPSARTLRGLGLTAFELGHYATCAAFLRRALANPMRPLDARVRAETAQLLARTEGLLSVVALTVTSGSALRSLARLSLDGGLPEPVPDVLELAVGEHVLELSAPSHLARRIRIDAHGGEHLTLQVALELLPSEREQGGPRVLASVLAPSVPAGTATSSASDEQVPRAQRWFWAGLGVITVAVALGLGFGLRTRPTQTAAAIAAQPVATRGGP